MSTAKWQNIAGSKKFFSLINIHMYTQIKLLYFEIERNARQTKNGHNYTKYSFSTYQKMSYSETKIIFKKMQLVLDVKSFFLHFSRTLTGKNLSDVHIYLSYNPTYSMSLLGRFTLIIHENYISRTLVERW